MIIYYKPDGIIYKTLKDSEAFYYNDPYGLALASISIDELDPLNKALCIDLYESEFKKDAVGDHKYRVNAGQLEEKVGWVEELDIIYKYGI